jgi:hypothetical protein
MLLRKVSFRIFGSNYLLYGFMVDIIKLTISLLHFYANTAHYLFFSWETLRQQTSTKATLSRHSPSPLGSQDRLFTKIVTHLLISLLTWKTPKDFFFTGKTRHIPTRN